jgi:hypothetical protein
MEGRMGSRMKSEHVESGTAKDIETIIRLRPWIEEEVTKRRGNFSDTKLITDYDANADIFSFKIIFNR